MIKKAIYQKVLIVDGAMGTKIHQSGVTLPTVLEDLNITHPDVITSIHKQYKDAGADIITTNSFGINSFKLSETAYSIEEHVKAAINCVKKVNPLYTAFDIGPSGKMMKPIGSITFDEMVDNYKELAIHAEKYGADFIFLETFNDIYELKSAIIAIKENTSLPIFCTVTFDESMRTLSGTDPRTFITSIAPLGVDALGVNCSLGPIELSEIVQELTTYSPVPVIVQPNRGLPKIDDLGNTYYDLDIKTYMEYMTRFNQSGVTILGGCCGTDESFIKALSDTFKNKENKTVYKQLGTTVSSYAKTVDFDEKIIVIGERINPTGRKLLRNAIKENSYDLVLKEAVKQVDAGADILDVNMGVPGINEVEAMKYAIESIQSILSTPLQIDSTDPKVIETACRYYNGRPIINSVNGEQKSLDAILPIVKKYGCLVLGLTLDEDGLPKTKEKRIEIAQKIVKEAKKHGINESQILFDALTLTVSAEQSQVFETLGAMKYIKEEMKHHTVLGVSNISFGLPNRKLINKTFINMALTYGLSAPIMNPMHTDVMEMIDAFRVLKGEDLNAINYIKSINTSKKEEVVIYTEDKDLKYYITNGLKKYALQETMRMLGGMKASDIIDDIIIPILFEVGERFEKKEIYLPELIQAAETSSYCLEHLKKEMKKDQTTITYKGKLILATVKGDIHDIGKNITKTLLENNGYDIYDLGRDVGYEKIVDTMTENNISVVGLSALMTTTVKNMEEIIREIRSHFSHKITIIVGGAVLTEEYAKNIDADYYAKDAQSAVKICNEIANLTN